MDHKCLLFSFRSTVIASVLLCILLCFYCCDRAMTAANDNQVRMISVSSWSISSKANYDSFITPAYYACIFSMAGTSYAVTVDRQTLQTVKYLWPEQQVFPLDSEQNTALVITPGATATAVELINRKHEVLRQWVIPAVTTRGILNGKVLIATSNKGIWVVNPDLPDLQQLDKMPVGSTFEINGEYILAWNPDSALVTLYRNYRFVWAKELDSTVQSVRIANNGTVLLNQWKTTKATENNINGNPQNNQRVNYQAIFRLVTADGEDQLLSELPLSGILMALSDNGEYALVGTQNAFKVITTAGHQVLWDGKIPTDNVVPQTAISNDGKTVLWEHRISNDAGGRQLLNSYITLRDKNGNLIWTTNGIWPGSPLMIKSIIITDGYIDCITNSGIKRFAQLEGGINDN